MSDDEMDEEEEEEEEDEEDGDEVDIMECVYRSAVRQTSCKDRIFLFLCKSNYFYR